jgi:hypothetical protein
LWVARVSGHHVVAAFDRPRQFLHLHLPQAVADPG